MLFALLFHSSILVFICIHRGKTKCASWKTSSWLVFEGASLCVTKSISECNGRIRISIKTSTITNDPTFTKNCTTDVKIKSHVAIYVFQAYPCILIKDEILSHHFNTTIIMVMYISHLPFYVSSLLRTSIATRSGHPIIWVTFCPGQRKSH